MIFHVPPCSKIYEMCCCHRESHSFYTHWKNLIVCSGSKRSYLLLTILNMCKVCLKNHMPTGKKFPLFREKIHVIGQSELEFRHFKRMVSWCTYVCMWRNKSIFCNSKVIAKWNRSIGFVILCSLFLKKGIINQTNNIVSWNFINLLFV